MNFPTDTRRFSLMFVLKAIAWLSIALAIAPHLPIYGFALPAAVGGYLFGSAAFFASDNIDPRPVDEKNLPSQIANILGILFAAASVVAFFATIIVNLLVYLAWR